MLALTAFVGMQTYTISQTFRKTLKQRTSHGAEDICSVVQGFGCSATVPGLDSQNLYDDTQPFLTLVPGDLIPSSGLHECKVGTWYTDMHAGTNTHTNEMIDR